MQDFDARGGAVVVQSRSCRFCLFCHSTPVRPRRDLWIRRDQILQQEVSNGCKTLTHQASLGLELTLIVIDRKWHSIYLFWRGIVTETKPSSIFGQGPLLKFPVSKRFASTGYRHAMGRLWFSMVTLYPPSQLFSHSNGWSVMGAVFFMVVFSTAELECCTSPLWLCVPFLLRSPWGLG
jgi:hypothetical protein